MQSSGKRLLSSPEEVQEAIRRRVTLKKSTAPPIGGILTSAQAPSRSQAVTPASGGPPSTLPQSKEAIIEAVHQAVKGISAVANASYKLNLVDKSAIAGHGQDILALVAQLTLRLAEVEHEVSATKLRALEMASAGAAPAAQVSGAVAAPSYASALKRPSGNPPLQVHHQGPAVIFYPDREDIKTSDDTKRVLQGAVKPGDAGIKITQVRRVGNSGVVVRTATQEAATLLKKAVPPGLRVAEPRARLPKVALRYLRADPVGDDLLDELHRINMADDERWPLARFREECKFAVKKQLGPKFLVVLECTSAARDKLVELGRVYVGWDEAEVTDHIRSTCCTKCQQYGHPEKYCRAKEMTCGKCGDNGHNSKECQSSTQCCATCKRFKRKDAHSHSTASPNCPARQHAEAQAANMVQYG